MPEPMALRYLAGLPQEPASSAGPTLVMIDLQSTCRPNSRYSSVPARTLPLVVAASRAEALP